MSGEIEYPDTESSDDEEYSYNLRSKKSRKTVDDTDEDKDYLPPKRRKFQISDCYDTSSEEYEEEDDIYEEKDTYEEEEQKDIDDEENTDGEEEQKKKISLLQLLLGGNNKSDEDMKAETLDEWVKDVKPSKRRKFRKMADKIYDKINTVPKRSDILQSKMPFKEKCAIFEQMEILDKTDYNSLEYFQIKKEIFRIIIGYKNTTENARELELIEEKEAKLIKPRKMPLKIKILKANVSEYNRAIIFDKYKQYSNMPVNKSEKTDFLKWIDWALNITNNFTPIPIHNTKDTLEVNRYLYSVKKYMDTYLYGMHDVKCKLLEMIAAKISNPNSKDLSMGLLGSPGVGKCLHPDTEILLKQGGIKRAEDIMIGDVLIGDDLAPRVVLSVNNGIDKMYRVKLENGWCFTVNAPHVLTLFNDDTYTSYDMPLNEFLSQPKQWQDKQRMFSVPVEYGYKVIKNDPYIIGLLLSNETITKKIQKVKTYVKCAINVGRPNMTSIDSEEVMDVIANNRIPYNYLYNSRNIRFQLLKSLCLSNRDDEKIEHKTTRGRSKNKVRPLHNKDFNLSTKVVNDRKQNNRQRSKQRDKQKKKQKSKRSKSVPRRKIKHVDSLKLYDNSKVKSLFDNYLKKEMISKAHIKTFIYSPNKHHTHNINVVDEGLAEQILFLVKSLGYNCVYNYPNITVYGDLNKLPSLNVINKHKFSIMPVGRGKYCGMTLTDNGRFLLSSCVVTHNTHLVKVFSEATRLPYYKINMGGSTDPSYFLGHSSTYIGSQPGIIVKAIKHMQSRTGFIYLDEFDKLEKSEWRGSSKVSDVFLHISDPVQQEEFSDEYLSEIKIDISNYSFIYSFNDEKNINPILRNRIPIIKVNGYSTNDKIAICKKYAIPALLKNIGVSDKDIIFTDDAIRYVVEETKSMDTDGMRTVKHVLHNLIKAFNIFKTTYHEDGDLLLNYKINKLTLPYTVTRQSFDDFNIIINNKQKTNIINMMYI